MTADTVRSNIENRIRGRRNRAMGLHAETMVLTQLRHHGFDCEKIETAWRVKRAGSKIVGATPAAKVLADIVGVQRTTGRAVLVEVKREDADTLAWSRLDAHQVVNLDRWHKAGALVFVAYVRGLHARLIAWRPPADLWGPGKGLPWNSAALMPLI